MLNKQTIIGVIGSGTMGNGIAQLASTFGHDVIVYDNNSLAIEKAKNSLKASLDKLVEKQKLSTDEVIGVEKRVKYVLELNELKSCGLVVEAIVENLDVKQQLFKELETIVDSNCILASNTSSLSITSIGGACKYPDKVIGIHFFNPATLMPLVEIIPGIATKTEVVNECKKLIDTWSKVTVICKDTPGFIVNRIARPFYGEAMCILQESIADVATIDWAMREIGGFKMGPFELTDLIGHDVNYTVSETVWKQFYFDPRYRPALIQKRLVEAKFFGRKSGKGFYNYNEGVVKPEPKKDVVLGQKIFLRIISMLVNEAIDALYLGVAQKQDIDLAMIKGVNYPKGLLKWGDEIGLDTILRELETLKDLYNDNRYRPSVLLKQMVQEKRKFF